MTLASGRNNKILRELLREGWVLVSQNKHYKLKSPSGKSTLIMSVSPSCQYTERKIRKDADKLIQKEMENESRSPSDVADPIAG